MSLSLMLRIVYLLADILSKIYLKCKKKIRSKKIKKNHQGICLDDFFYLYYAEA
jgi:hypothetical protein